MELVVMTILLLVTLSFLLRITLSGKRIAVVWCAAAALFILLTRETATGQSKNSIAEWLSRPELMLDTAVWITAEVAFQIGFCLIAAKASGGRLKRTEQTVYRIFRILPGALILPTLFALHTELVFALPGVDFGRIAWGMAGGVLLLPPLLAAALRRLIPETDIRLELLFLVNLLIATLGIVSTVNGRTAAAGTNRIAWAPLAGTAALFAAGAIAGACCDKYLENKKISKIK